MKQSIKLVRLNEYYAAFEINDWKTAMKTSVV